MEPRFSMNDFEESLREHADEFKMTPSKRVWHGIYNDLHPGRRWPSVAMSLLLIFTLVLVGHLNTHTGSQVHNINKEYFSSKSESVKTTATSSANRKSVPGVNNFKHGSNTTLSPQLIANKLKAEASANNSDNDASRPSVNTSTKYPNITPMANQAVLEKHADDAEAMAQRKRLTSPNSIATSQNDKPTSQLTANTEPTTEVDNNNNNYDNANLNSSKDISNYHTSKIDLTGKNIELNNVFTTEPDIRVNRNKNTLSTNRILSPLAEKNSIDKQKTVDSKTLAKTHRKRNAKTGWVFYAAPEVSSVSFSGQPIKPVANPASSPAVAINQKENRIIYNSSFGFEAGTQFHYGITKKLMFTTGLQVTYSGYKIVSNQVHPTLSTLLLKDPKTEAVYSKNYLTHYGDGTGLSVVPLRNYSLQASLPIGLQYELFGNKKLQINMAGNLEPSLILKSNAYVLSSDGSNYINDPSLLRKWNMSSNFGLFVTFRSHNLRWQIGPNVRYQWLSTYKKDYTIRENLIDYGLRIGISR